SPRHVTQRVHLLGAIDDGPAIDGFLPNDGIAVRRPIAVLGHYRADLGRDAQMDEVARQFEVLRVPGKLIAGGAAPDPLLRPGQADVGAVIARARAAVIEDQRGTAVAALDDLQPSDRATELLDARQRADRFEAGIEIVLVATMEGGGDVEDQG